MGLVPIVNALGALLCRLGLHRRVLLAVTVGYGIAGYELEEDCHREGCSWHSTRTVRQ
jgi:hypothetical protein